MLVERLILASSSERRAELIKKFGLPYVICPASCDETFDPNQTPFNNLLSVSYRKAEATAKAYELKKTDVIVAADTVVVAEGEILKKPKNEEDAKAMLRFLSGRVHEVLSGVTLLSKEKNVSFCASTFVEFEVMSDEEINYYVSTGEPMDKAGAYGIQGLGSLYIKGIEGCFYNVMGLPVAKTYKILKAEFMR